MIALAPLKFRIRDAAYTLSGIETLHSIGHPIPRPRQRLENMTHIGDVIFQKMILDESLPFLRTRRGGGTL